MTWVSMIRSWLAATLRGETPVFDQVSLSGVDEVLAVARDHGVTLLLHDEIKLAQKITGYPQKLLDRLAELERNEVATELFRLSESRIALSSLYGAEISVLVLKGTALAYGLYEKPYLRPRGDTDILLQNAVAAEAAGVVLKTIGYESSSLMHKPSKNAISFEMQYRRSSKLGSSQSLDVHWALANNGLYATRFSNAELLAGARELPMLGSHAKSLGWVHAMAHACIHRVAHLPEGLGGRLIWLYDMHLLAGRFSEEDWAELLYLAEQRQLAGAILDGLRATIDAFHTAMPSNILPTLTKLTQTEGFKVSKAGSATYIDLQGLYWMTNAQRWHWLWQTFFPPAEHMRKRDGLTSSLQLPFAYFKRIFQRLFRSKT